MNALYVARKGGRHDQLLFTDEAVSEASARPARRCSSSDCSFSTGISMGVHVLTANGHIEEEIEKAQPGAKYRQPAQLFWNAGGAPAFVPVGGPRLAGTCSRRWRTRQRLRRPGWRRRSGWSSPGCRAPLILRNDQKLGHHWLRLKLKGNASTGTRSVRVTVRSGGRTMSRQVMPTKSYLSQSELPVTFGLGSGIHSG